MILRSKIIAFFVMVLALAGTTSPFIRKYKRKKQDYDVSFLLPNKKIDFSYEVQPTYSLRAKSFMLYSPEGFLCYLPNNDSYQAIKERLLIIDKKPHGMYLNAHHCAQSEIYLMPRGELFYINGNPTSGSVALKNNKHALEMLGNGRHYSQMPINKIHDTSRVGKEILSAMNIKDNLGINTIFSDKEVILKDVCQSKKLSIRVLLESHEELHKEWCFISKNGFVIWDQALPSQSMFYNKTHLKIKYTQTGWLLNDKKMSKKSFCIAPPDGHISFNGKDYLGSFTIMRTTQANLLINTLDIEDYVMCVLRTESWPGWPLEVNKVLAITSRTYALSMILQSRKSKQPYHIKNTNQHQTYQGTHNNTVIKEAVEQTRGMFIAYDNKPILAMFDVCCGGVIPAHIAERCNFQEAPYLARSYACTYCKKLKVYSWKVELTMQEFQKRIAQHFPHPHLKEVKVTAKDKAGLAQSVLLKSVKDARVISGQKLYSLLSEVKSYCFDIRRKANMITIAGRGYGHHLGLCQWGAREMVRDGWHFKRILQFYYPGTDIKCLA